MEALETIYKVFKCRLYNHVLFVTWSLNQQKEYKLDYGLFGNVCFLTNLMKIGYVARPFDLGRVGDANFSLSILHMWLIYFAAEEGHLEEAIAPQCLFVATLWLINTQMFQFERIDEYFILTLYHLWFYYTSVKPFEIAKIVQSMTI